MRGNKRQGALMSEAGSLGKENIPYSVDLMQGPFKRQSCLYSALYDLRMLERVHKLSDSLCVTLDLSIPAGRTENMPPMWTTYRGSLNRLYGIR